jgi:hypothetical protein
MVHSSRIVYKLIVFVLAKIVRDAGISQLDHQVLAGMVPNLAYLAASIDGYSRKSPGWRRNNEDVGFSVDCLEDTGRSQATLEVFKRHQHTCYLQRCCCPASARGSEIRMGGRVRALDIF